jgi:hypothetical protein
MTSSPGPSSPSKESLDADVEKAQQPDEEQRSVDLPAESDNTITEKDETTPVPPQNAGPSPPPDGGLVAWMQVLGSFMLFFNTWGILK